VIAKLETIRIAEAQVFFDVIDIPLNDRSDVVSIVPFFCISQGTRVSSEVFFRIDIDHAPTFGGGAGILTLTFPVHLFGLFIIEPFGFRAYKFKCFDGSSHFRTFRFHRKGIIVWTTRDSVFIDGIVNLLQLGSGIKRDVGFRKVFIVTKRISRKKVFI